MLFLKLTKRYVGSWRWHQNPLNTNTKHFKEAVLTYCLTFHWFNRLFLSLTSHRAKCNITAPPPNTHFFRTVYILSKKTFYINFGRVIQAYLRLLYSRIFTDFSLKEELIERRKKTEWSSNKKINQFKPNKWLDMCASRGTYLCLP